MVEDLDNDWSKSDSTVSIMLSPLHHPSNISDQIQGKYQILFSWNCKRNALIKITQELKKGRSNSWKV